MPRYTLAGHTFDRNEPSFKFDHQTMLLVGPTEYRIDGELVDAMTYYSTICDLARSSNEMLAKWEPEHGTTDKA